MLFHTQVFLLLFLPATVMLFYRFAHQERTREYVLIAASLVFYGWWDYRFLPLIVGQTLVSWLLASLYEARPVRAVLIVAIALNLSVLGLFKYLNFLFETVRLLSGLTLPESHLILPIGISFYTFQIISYLADLMRDQATPRYGLRRFLLYVMLFPQLIAGPIVRHNEIMSQFDLDPRRPGVAERISRGLALFVMGLIEKVIIADRLAGIADPIYASAMSSIPTTSDTLIAILAFTLELFFDFSAYSDMAIGIGLMLGLTLPENFDRPYRAATISEFWQRMHMTLTRFLRDYVFRPVCPRGSGFGRYAYAVALTMGLVGLWHGAGWTYLLFGLIQGAGLISFRIWQMQPRRLPVPVAWALTFGFFALTTGVVFRAPDIATSWRMLAGLVGQTGLGAMPPMASLGTVTLAGIVATAGLTAVEVATRRFRSRPMTAVGLAIAMVYCVLAVGQGQPQSFIYFQY